MSIEHSVVVAGGGPTGLMLAGELALAGVDVAIAERRANQDLIGSRAGGLHSRTIEVLDQRGIADRFLTSGQIAQVAGFSQIRLDISDFPTRHPYGLALWQNHIERILAGWVEELAVTGLSRTRGHPRRSGRHWGRCPPVRRPAIAGGVSGRLRRRTQCGPEISGHRLPGLGSDDELSARRGRVGSLSQNGASDTTPWVSMRSASRPTGDRCG